MQRAQELVTLQSAIRSIVANHGGIRATERATGVDKGYLSRMMSGHQTLPREETLRALGLRAVPLYEVLNV